MATTKHISPRGTAAYAWLSKPDNKFSGGDPTKDTYKIDLILANLSDAQPLIDTIQPGLDAYVAAQIEADPKKKKWGTITPWAMVEDDDGDETGEVVVKFKQNAIINGKRGQIKIGPIPTFDSTGKAMPGDIEVYGGSVVKVEYSVRYFPLTSQKVFGARLDLSAVQVIELVKPGGNAGSGFGAEEGGYVADDSDRTEAAGGNPFGDEEAGDEGSAPPVNTDEADF